LVHRARWFVDEVAVSQDVNLLSREDREQIGELMAVATEFEIAPERCEARAHATRFQAARREEIGLGLEAVAPKVRPVRIGAIHWVADDCDQLGVRNEATDASVRGPVPQIERRALA